MCEKHCVSEFQYIKNGKKRHLEKIKWNLEKKTKQIS